MTSMSFLWPFPGIFRNRANRISSHAYCASSLISHWSLGSHDVTLRTASSGRDRRARAARHASRHRTPGTGVEDGLGGLHGAGQRHARAHRSRLRARPRDVAVRRAGRGAQGADLPADRGLLLPGHDARHGHWLDPGAGHGRQRQRRAGACRRAVSPYARQAAPRRTPSRRTSTPRPGGWWSPVPAPCVQYYKAAWHNWKKLTGDVEFFRSSGALTLRVAGTTAHLSWRPAAQQQQHRERARARRLRPGRGAARDARVLAARRRARAGRRRADLRRLRPCRAPHALLRHLRHDLLPGLRRLRLRGLPWQRCRRRHGRQGAHLRRQARVHPVRVEQRRLALRRQPALPGREGRLVRQLQRQPDAHVDQDPHQGVDPEGLPRPRHPQAGAGHPT